MTSFADLPSDIIMAITSLQHHATGMVPGWKHVLRTLSICRSWRATMLPIIYAAVFIIIPDDDLHSYLSKPQRLPIVYKVPYTNAGLIYTNGYGFLVKRIIIHVQTYFNISFPWLYVAEALDINENKFPELSAVRDWIESNAENKYLTAPRNDACNKVFGPAAHMLALRFPNVSSLGIKDKEYSSTQTDVPSTLVSAYTSQLVTVDLEGYRVNPAFLKATNIRHFVNNVYSGFKDIPFINPELLTSLNLRSHSNRNIWNQFVCDKDTNSIEFTNLESLQLHCGRLESDAPLHTRSCHLEFPKLTHLKADDGIITNSDFQLMALNLKTLDYSGFCKNAIKLLENNTSSLEKLHLQLVLFTNGDHNYERFISETNTIFSMVGLIPEISCAGLQAHHLQLSRIYWPNLTWLELKTSIEPYKFLRSINCIPHLQHLRLIIIHSSKKPNHIQYADEYAGISGTKKYNRIYKFKASKQHSYNDLAQLSYLKRYGQSQSTLATLTIHWYIYYAYDWHLKNINSNRYADKGPGLETFVKRQPRCRTKHLCIPISNYDPTHYSQCNLDVIGRSNCEEPMENSEADAALSAYFPNLIATKFVFVTHGYNSNKSRKS